MEIIAQRDIETQEDLAETLKSEGFDVTQATVSRDIKNLKLIKYDYFFVVNFDFDAVHEYLISFLLFF